MHHQKSKLNQHGFHLIEGIIILAVLGAIGFIGFNVMNKNSPTNSETTTESKVDPNTTGPPVWEYNQDKLEWFVKSGAATKCELSLIHI